MFNQDFTKFDEKTCEIAMCIFVPTYLKKDDYQLGQADQQLPTHAI